MNIGVVIFPGSNCDRDLYRAFQTFSPNKVEFLWHKNPELPKGIDVCAIPGGFSFGDYLRTGAIASRSPIIKAIIEFAHAGGFVLGICNGFQILCECGLLPGALIRNQSTQFICRDQELIICHKDPLFTNLYDKNQKVSFPIAHHDGNYFVDTETHKVLIENDQIAFRYQGKNPNGSVDNIAGIYSHNHRILGLMPHPERRVDPEIGGNDGALFFKSICDGVSN
ncbi:MAG: phosphoribosylformylglycinamidine synthase subunit PurQ [Rhodobacteraceae bacterium]|nr:MAG: phosphoribosylformylglycinamidine synthase subunit PurQ [Paracoccaceae bacterium]